MTHLIAHERLPQCHSQRRVNGHADHAAVARCAGRRRSAGGSRPHSIFRGAVYVDSTRVSPAATGVDVLNAILWHVNGEPKVHLDCSTGMTFADVEQHLERLAREESLEGVSAEAR